MVSRGATDNILDFQPNWSELFGMRDQGNNRTDVVIRLSHLGDVALTTGVLARWHAQDGRTFVFVTKRANTPLLENHPAISRIIGLDDSALGGLTWFKNALRLAREYKGADLIDLHGTLRSRILSLVWSGTVRRYPKFGLTRRLYDKTKSEQFRSTLDSLNVPQRYAMALEPDAPPASDLVPSITVTEAEATAAAKRLQAIGLSHPVVALHPYATHASKQWPREYWITLTRLLMDQGIDWFIIGRDDTPILPGNSRDMTGKTDLRQTCGLLSQASLLVTGDSGPMHLACGVGTPVTALFGPTTKAWGFFPSGPRDRILENQLECRPCSLHGSNQCDRGYDCMVSIKPEKVFATIAEMLAAR